MLMRHKVFLNHIAIRSRQHAYSAVGFGLLQRNIQKRLQAAVVIFAQTNLVNLLYSQGLAIQRQLLEALATAAPYYMHSL